MMSVVKARRLFVPPKRTLILLARYYLLSLIEQAHSKTMTRWFSPKLPITCIKENFRQKIAAAVHMTSCR